METWSTQEALMSELTDALRKRLADADEEFRGWSREHRECESRLAMLAEKRSLSTEEEIEEKDLKKRKLHLKDLMAGKARQFTG
jgi:uncharacterized protein YdcH (DUF465 family)